MVKGVKKHGAENDNLACVASKPLENNCIESNEVLGHIDNVHPIAELLTTDDDHRLILCPIVRLITSQ